MIGRLVWLNGKPAPEADTSAGHLQGVTCFETLAVHHGQPVFLDRHLNRLATGLDVLHLAPAGGLEAIREQVLSAASTLDEGTGLLRVSCHARGQARGLELTDEAADVLVVASAPRYGDLDGGVAAVTSTVRAPDPASFPATFKAPCLARTLAHREARDRGTFEGLMLDARGHVNSGTRSNILAMIEGTWRVTPAPPAVPGVTRAVLLEHLAEQGVAHEVAAVHRDALEDADELVLSFTGPGVVPVTELDGAPVGEGTPGPATKRLAEAHKAAVARSTRSSGTS